MILLVSIVCMFLVITTRQRISESHTLSGTMQMVIVFISCSILGYTLRAIAANPEEYMFGQKLILLGGSFLYFFLFSFYRRFLAVKMPRAVVIFCTFMCCALSALTFTFNRHHLIYKSFEPFLADDGHYDCEPTIGILMHVYLFMIVFYSVGLLVMAIWNFKVSRKKSHRTRSRMLLVVAISCPALPLVIDLSFKPQYEFTPFGFLVCELLLMYLLNVEKIHDIADLARDFVFKSIDDGIIILDNDLLFSSCNERASEIFPELKKITKNTRMSDISERLGKIADGSLSEVKINDRYYYVTKKSVENEAISGKKAIAGTVLMIDDITEHKKHMALMANYQAELEQEVKLKTTDIENMRDRLVINIANMIENRDNPTGGHVKRTSDVVAILISSMMEDNEFGLSDEFYDAVIKTAPMHDLGKMAVDDKILLKPGKFTPEEFDIMKTHTTMGAKFVDSVLENVNEKYVVQVAENIAHYHHEKWNGEGYPEHLAGDAIPIEARIMAIADVYDALVSKRCYKEKMSFDQAYQVIISSMGTHFDPKLEKYFVRCHKLLENYYADVTDN